MTVDSFDAIVIGAGHNGLVAACYLARAGWKVLVLERRDIVGGACVTEEIFPGYKVSTAAYVTSLLRPEIIKDLRLRDFGYEVLLRDPSSFSPFPDRRHLLFWRDRDRTLAEIAKFSTKDAERYPAYERELEQIAALVEPMLLKRPPKPNSRWPGDWLAMARLGWTLRRKSASLVRLFSMSVADYLDRWFESEELKARLATDGVIGAMAGPRTPGTAYVLFHHVMGQTEGQSGVWGYVRGGMGTITRAMADYFLSQKGTIWTDADVQRVLVKESRAEGVALSDGRVVRANVILSSADPKRTFLSLFDPFDLPEDLLAEVKAIRMASGTVKINVALNGVPDFLAYPGSAPGPQHRGTIHFCPNMAYIETAFEDAKWGRPASKPVVEMCLPSVVDPSLAPPGKQLASLFVQYAPYHRADGRPWNSDTEPEFVKATFNVIREYAPNWNDLVDDVQVLSPKGLEERFGLTGGNIFHGEMTLDQLLFLRPTESCSRYRTPIEQFYLCGSGCHPGGGVMGAPGYLAAQAVLRSGRR